MCICGVCVSDFSNANVMRSLRIFGIHTFSRLKCSKSKKTVNYTIYNNSIKALFSVFFDLSSSFDSNLPNLHSNWLYKSYVYILYNIQNDSTNVSTTTTHIIRNVDKRNNIIGQWYNMWCCRRISKSFTI